MRAKYPKKGFILLIVLSLLAAMTLLMLHLVEVVKLERELSNDYLNKTRSRILARSGLEYATASVLGNNPVRTQLAINNEIVPLGNGTYGTEKDIFELSVKEANGKININDGLKAGSLESIDDANRQTPINWVYDASVVDPWPMSDLEAPDKSGLINLRLRRLLNAYGDTHIAEANGNVTVTDWNYNAGFGSLPGTLKFTSSATGDRGKSMPLPAAALRGLGDVLITNRPRSGYEKIDDAKGIINSWGNLHLSATYMGDETFYDKVTGDLTINSFEDNTFNRLRTETAATFDSIDDNVNKADSAHMWHYQNNHKDCRFVPNFLDRFPINLTDNSGNGEVDPKTGLVIKVDNHLWAPHSVSLINLNSASRLVKAATFFAPTNVSYLCEGAVTHEDRAMDRDDRHIYPSRGGDYQYLQYMGIGRSSIGVRGPCFNPIKMTENGQDDSDPNVQVNRLMSMRDAMKLAKAYEVAQEIASTDPTKDILNFEDFKNFLTDYRKDKRISSPSSVIYERAEIIPLNTTGSKKGTIKFDNLLNRVIYYGKKSNSDSGDITKKVQALFVDPDDPYDTDVVWVSQYWPEATDTLYDSSDHWAGGWFLEDYVERTLPHIFSCVRRIPGYLGAPAALTSPYMIVEPYCFIDVLTSPLKRDNLGRLRNAGGALYPLTETTKIDEVQKHITRQPKISVEDLVTRHTIPKVCFLSQGYFDIRSVGVVRNDQDEIVAKTTMRISAQLFETKYFRTQKDIVSLMERTQDNDNKIKYVNNTASPGGYGSFEDFNIGPEFKIKDVVASGNITHDERVASKYWLSLGLKDSNETAGTSPSPSNAKQLDGGTDYVKSWDIFLDANIRNNTTYSKAKEENGLAQTRNADVTTILSDYGSTSWSSQMIDDTRIINTASHPGYWTALHGWYHLDPDTHFLPTADLNTLYVPDTNRSISKENVVLSSKSDVYKRKFQDRLMMPIRSTLKAHGQLEDAVSTLWAAQDGHDVDAFGNGIFVSQNGNGRYTDKKPTTTLIQVHWSYPKVHNPINFRDILYWNLGNKTKKFDQVSDVNGDKKVTLAGDDADGNGILDVYDFEDPTGFPFRADGPNGGDRNPTGVGFHRGFMAAWFRVPTSYPFAHMVYSEALGRIVVSANSATVQYNKVGLFRTIMSLHLNNQSDWGSTDNDSKIIPQPSGGPAFRWWGGLDEMNTTHPHTGTHSVDIRVGYYSGFNTGNFNFEHGILGRYQTGDYQAGVHKGGRGISTTRYRLGGHGHPLDLEELVTSTHKTKPGQFYYNKGVHGYFWDYDHMRPNPFHFDTLKKYSEPKNRFMGRLTTPHLAPTWFDENATKYEDIGYPFSRYHYIYGNGPVGYPAWGNRGNEKHNDTLAPGLHGPTVSTYVPFYHMMWKQEFAAIINDPLYNNFLGITNPANVYKTMPVNHILYASHADRSVYTSYQISIRHKLAMDRTPECAPGTWHRIYAFWFMRFNPGTMGQNGPTGVPEQGDSLVFSNSNYWSVESETVIRYVSNANPGTYPDTHELPHAAYYEGGIAPSFPATQSRYATDDAKLDATETNAAFDVDGLDQFGIWFRDDSNYSNLGNSSTGILLKPTYMYSSTGWYGREIAARDSTSDYDGAYGGMGPMHVSFGKTALVSPGSYSPFTGEKEYGGDGSGYGWNSSNIFSRYPGFTMDSVIDNIIFGYGPDISMPGTSYFRGLFHNANWLSDTLDPYRRHADEVRYNIRNGVYEPVLNLDFSNSAGSPAVPDNSSVLHLGTRIYYPRDTLDVVDEDYNYSELRFNVTRTSNDTLLVDPNDSTPNTPWTGSSKNYQDHFFSELVTSNVDKLVCQFKYTGMKRKHDHTLGVNPVEVESILANYNQENGSNFKYAIPSGDSFTNIPYIQEISVRFIPPSGTKYLNWSED